MKRRAFIIATAAALVAPALAQNKPMKIGVIGSGRIGSTIGGLWVKAGHEVMFSDRDPEQVKRATDGLGPRARAGSVVEAVAFGDAILIAVPYMALPAIQQQVGEQLKGKVVIDPNNPVASRDG
ncbi:MAG TPA: NAD(P)-binding domain-containing protein, partial [Burkholderiales bacterium]|nr:NAD(P)-binding domain-containing protein [Burkholderiales bacterium]